MRMLLGMRRIAPALGWLVLALSAQGAAAQVDARDAQPFNIVPRMDHPTLVHAVDFSPDGRFVLSAGGNSLKLWEAATGREIRTFSHTSIVADATFSPDGLLAVSANCEAENDNLDCTKSSLKLWELTTGHRIPRFGSFAGGIASVSFSSDGTFVLADSGLRHTIWEVQSGKSLRSFRGEGLSVLSRDGRLALTGGGEVLRTWITSTGKELQRFVGHKRIASVALSADGRLALSGSWDSTIKSWDIEKGRELRTFVGHKHAVLSVALSPDGKFALSGSYDGALMLWEVGTGQPLKTFTGHRGLVRAVAISPDSGTAVSAGDDGRVRFWDLVAGRELFGRRERTAKARSAIYSSDGRFIAVAGRGETPRLWDAASGRLIRRIGGSSKFAEGVAFSADGHALLSYGLPSRPRSWQVGTGELARDFGRDASSAAFSRDGRLLALSRRETLDILDANTGSTVRSISHKGTSVLAFSSDGSLILSGATSGYLKVFDVSTGSERYSASATAAAFAPDGHSIILANTGDSDNRMKMRDIETGKELRAFKGHQDTVTAIAFSSDGKLIVSAGWDHSIKLWNAQAGVEVRTLNGHTDWVNSAAFSPDGRHVVSSSSDGTVRVWNVYDGTEVARLIAAGDEWVTMTPAGFFDYGGSGDVPLHLVRGLTTYSIHQVFDYLYRPDLVQALLMGDRESKHKNAAYSLNLQAVLDTGPSPQIEHLADRTERARDTVRLTVRLTDDGGGIGKRIVWRVNGVAQGSPTPSALANVASPFASVVVSETLKLLPGMTNVVEVSAYNRAGLVASAPLKITVDSAGATTEPRPRMFVLALGVDAYRMKEYRLGYAAHDAVSIAKALEVVGSTLFAKVHPTVLTDAQVNEAGIAKAIDDIAREATPTDVFVLFLAGHGQSIAKTYYYWPQTIDWAAGHTVPTHGIGQDTWEAWLRKIPVQKSLLVIDTCEGDAFRGSRGTDAARQTAMVHLQNATGRNIIAASRDAAREGYQGHGVLTYAILEALAKAESAARDEVRIKAVADYVEVRVPQITQSVFGVYQKPTGRLVGTDFPIGIRKQVLTLVGEPTVPKEPTHVLIRNEVVRMNPAADAPPSRSSELRAGMQVRAVEYFRDWVMVARDGQKLGYVPVDALARLQ